MNKTFIYHHCILGGSRSNLNFSTLGGQVVIFFYIFITPYFKIWCHPGGDDCIHRWLFYRSIRDDGEGGRSFFYRVWLSLEYVAVKPRIEGIISSPHCRELDLYLYLIVFTLQKLRPWRILSNTCQFFSYTDVTYLVDHGVEKKSTNLSFQCFRPTSVQNAGFVTSGFRPSLPKLRYRWRRV